MIKTRVPIYSLEDLAKLEVMDIVEDMYSMSNTIKDAVQGNIEEFPQYKTHSTSSGYRDLFSQYVIESIKNNIEEDKESELKYEDYIPLDPDWNKYSSRNGFIENSFRLSKAIALESISRTNIIPTYDEAYNETCRSIEIECKKIEGNTNCNKDTLYHQVILLYNASIYEIYKIYHSIEVNEKNLKKSSYFKELAELNERLTYSHDSNKADEIIKEIENIEKELFDIDKKELYTWFDNEKLDKLINKIINDVYAQDSPINKEDFTAEILNSVMPTKYIIPNNRLINKMAKDQICYNEPFDLEVHGTGKREVLTRVSLNYDDENIEIPNKDKRFTPYDRSVHNAVVSIYEAGNLSFTPSQVYRCMNGFSEGEYVSDESKGLITESIDKTRRIYTKVNYTSEAKAWKKDIDNCVIEDHILSAKKVVLEAGGNKVTGYKLNSKPILYEYSQVTGQVLTVPSYLLNTKGVLNSSPENTVISEHLIREIEWMKKKRSTRNNKITLEGIYDELELGEPTKYKTRRIRDKIVKILDNLKKVEYIEDHKFYNKGRTIVGIEIFY